MKQFLAVVFVSMAVWAGDISTAQAQVVVKAKPVRPKVVVVKGRAPRRGMVWVDGHWSWNKRNMRYIWVKGRWAAPPRGKAWTVGSWKRSRKGWVYVPGRWV